MQEDYKRELQALSIGFSALLCISFGLILLASCLFLARAKPTAFFTLGIFGVAAIVLMYRRIANYRRSGTALERGEHDDANGKWRNPSFLLASLFLISTGYIGAKAAETGWVTPFAPYVMFVFLFPWSQIELCRRSPATSLSILCAGMVVGLVTADRLPHPLLLGVTTWILWTASVFAWLRLILIDRQKLGSTRVAGQEATRKVGSTSEALHNSST